jgi:hypothetical protein
LIRRHAARVKRLRAIAFDVGDQDRAVSIPSIVRMDQALKDANVDHTFEQYPGTHVSRVPERIENKMFPFFLEMGREARP